MSDVTWQVRLGDVREGLASLPAQSVQCCVTSPPYWGLRDYGTATWDGGDPACDHREYRGGTGLASSKQVSSAGASTEYYARNTCRKCGARRIDNQLGLEPTPDAYVAALVDVFRGVWRVLRDDGTVFLNLGDSYASSGGERTYGSSDGATGRGPGTRRFRHSHQKVDASPYGSDGTGFEDYPGDGSSLSDLCDGCRDVLSRHTSGIGGRHVPTIVQPRLQLKPKDLVGIPWRVAFALQADGWYLRSAITWCKGNPMPESVTDRPTKATEMLFLLAKSSRYFYDADAIREGVSEPGVVARTDSDDQSAALLDDFWLQHAGSAWTSVCVRLAAAVFNLAQREHEVGLFALDSEIGQQGADGGAGSPVIHVPVVRRAAAQAARFANGDIAAKQFLQEMNRLCVALPDGDDLKEAWRLAALHVGHVNADRNRAVAVHDAGKVSQIKRVHESNSTARVPSSGRNKRDWWVVNSQPYPEAHFATYPEALIEPCILAGSRVGDTVLDPFTGSGTTGAVAVRHQRSFIGCELNPAYLELARRRIGAVAPLLAREVA